jgi:hypothetical protein
MPRAQSSGDFTRIDCIEQLRHLMLDSVLSGCGGWLSRHVNHQESHALLRQRRALG